MASTHRENPVPPRTPAPAEIPRERRRSFTLLEREGERWTALLATYPAAEGGWRGYLAFQRSGVEEAAAEEVRTAVLFVERTEGEVDTRAQGLGRPLLLALLESALHAQERRRGPSPDLRRWFRDLLVRHEVGVFPATPAGATEDLSLARLRSLYQSYRVDQVVHLIALLPQDDFRVLVERLLDGRTIDFRARDRFQLAMEVVQELERRLPLPPFEAWVEDYLMHPQVYELYSHLLHRGEGDLP